MSDSCMPTAPDHNGQEPRSSIPACQEQSMYACEDAAKISRLVDLAKSKKQNGNEALAAGRHVEALDFFEGALKALQYVVPAADAPSNDSGSLQDRGSPAVAEARSLQVNNSHTSGILS